MWRRLVLVLAVLGMGTQAHAESRVVLISIDGLRPDFYLDPEAQHAELPNLRKMMREGVYAEGVVGTYPSVTYPSHTSIVTGVRPARHGIVNNYVLDESGLFDDWYWKADRIAVPALWDVADGVVANVHWPVTVGASAIDYNLPEFWIPGSTQTWRDVRLPVTTPALLEVVERELGRLPDEYLDGAPLETFAFDVAELVLERLRPHLLLVHAIHVDTEQHRFGREHPAVTRAFEYVDRRIGRLRSKLQALGVADETLLLVTGDHGFIQTHSEIHLNAALHDAGLIELDREGAIQSYDAIAWPAGGASAIVLKDPDDAATKRRVETFLEDLLEGPLGGILRKVDETERQRLGAMPEALVMLDAEPGYYFGKRRRGPVLTAGEDLGFHGYLPTRDQMRTGFLMVGPRVRSGLRVPSLRQIDIAPTIAFWAGWELEGTDGLALRGLFEEGS